MQLVYIGLGVIGLLMSISAAGIFSYLRQKLRKNPFGDRTGPKVHTIIHVRKESDNEP